MFVPDWLIEVLIILFAGAVGWWNMQQHGEIKELKSKQGELRADLPFQYVLREDHQRAMDRIESMFKTIMEQVSNKVDKP